MPRSTRAVATDTPELAAVRAAVRGADQLTMRAAAQHLVREARDGAYPEAMGEHFIAALSSVTGLRSAVTALRNALIAAAMPDGRYAERVLAQVAPPQAEPDEDEPQDVATLAQASMAENVAEIQRVGRSRVRRGIQDLLGGAPAEPVLAAVREVVDDMRAVGDATAGINRPRRAQRVRGLSADYPAGVPGVQVVPTDDLLGREGRSFAVSFEGAGHLGIVRKLESSVWETGAFSGAVKPRRSAVIKAMVQAYRNSQRQEND